MKRFKRLIKTCHTCPSQWEGVLHDGRCVYIRYRWGMLGVGLGTTPQEAIDNYDFSIEVGCSLDGFMTTAEMLAHFDRFVKEPK